MKRKLMDLHHELIKAGDYAVARRVYQLLRSGHITLGLGDTDWATEMLLEKASIPIRHSHDGNWAHVKLAA